MGDNTQICRLCLDAVPAGDGQAIEETEKEMLQVLLINIDFNITENAVACSRCLKTLQDCFDFKSTCFDADDYISPLVNSDVKVDNKKVSKKEIVSNENVGIENFRVCRLCMSVREEVFNYATDTDSKDGVRKDFDDAHELLFCTRCMSNTKKYNEFMKTCHEVEQMIKNYCQAVEGYSTTDRVSLDDVLKFNNFDTISKPVVIKKECSDVETVDMKVMCPENEDIVSIKCENINIKDEIDTGAKTEKFDEVNDCNSSGNSGSSKKTREIKTSASKGEKQFCNKRKRHYSSGKNSDIKRHTRSQTVDKMHKCTFCNFVTDTWLSWRTHFRCHRGPTKKYGCPECSYETNFSGSIGQHLLKHKDYSQVKMHKCPSCPYKSKYRGALKTHQKMKHQGNLEIYKCKSCSFSTKYKRSFTFHQMLHKNPQEMPKYKCEMCDFETKYNNLTQHMRIHEDPTVANKYKCEKCPYTTKWHSSFKEHITTHSSELPYSCDECNYSSKRASSLRAHKRSHQKIREGRYKCKLCNYQAKCTRTIRAHTMRTHTDPSEVSNFKCAHCPYETAIKPSLMLHMRRKHDSEKQPQLECELCHYVTSDKAYMQKHSLVHQEATIQCNQCNFRTKQKRYLRKHMFRHEANSPSSSKQLCD